MSVNRLLPLLLALFLLVGCGENGVYHATMITEGTHVFSRGEPLSGLLLILGGAVRVEEGARASGPLYLLDGSLLIEGEVEGDVTVLGGALTLGRAATVRGTLTVSGGIVARDPQATIGRLVERDAGTSLPLSPAWARAAAANRLRWFLIDSLGLALLAYAVARFMPRWLANVEQAIGEQPVVAAAFGILTGVVAPALLVLMAFTVILIPLALLGGLLLLMATGYGLIACGTLVGRWLTRHMAWGLALPGQAALGTLLFMLGLNVVGIVPLLGGLVPLLVMATALGAALLTRLGWRRFVPAVDRMPEAVPVAPLVARDTRGEG